MPPMAAIFAIGSGSLAVPQLSEDFSSAARDFVLSRMVDERKTSNVEETNIGLVLTPSN